MCLKICALVIALHTYVPVLLRLEMTAVALTHTISMGFATAA